MKTMADDFMEEMQEAIRMAKALGVSPELTDLTGKMSEIMWSWSKTIRALDGQLGDFIEDHNTPSKAPKIRIRCERVNGVVHGSKYVEPQRVELEDDGSIAVVIDLW